MPANRLGVAKGLGSQSPLLYKVVIDQSSRSTIRRTGRLLTPSMPVVIQRD
jgi:hypothetical protein